MLRVHPDVDRAQSHRESGTQEGIGMASSEARAARLVRFPMGRVVRAQLAALGLVLVALGLVVVFRTSNDVSSAALLTGGALCVVLAMRGEWPTRVTMGSGAADWDAAEELLVKAQDTSPETAEALVDVATTLLGDSPPDNAYRYDLLVETVLRSLSTSPVQREVKHAGVPVDFLVRRDGRSLFVETKFTPAGSARFRGRTLEPLLEAFDDSDEHLLVITNAPDARVAQSLVHERLRGRGDVIAWSGTASDLNDLTRKVNGMLDR
jgi:hypothetical protein